MEDIEEHNLAVSGGTDKTRIYTSFNYYDNKAILKNSDFVRYTGRVNLEQKIKQPDKIIGEYDHEPDQQQ